MASVRTWSNMTKGVPLAQGSIRTWVYAPGIHSMISHDIEVFVGNVPSETRLTIPPLVSIDMVHRERELIYNLALSVFVNIHRVYSWFILYVAQLLIVFS